MEESIPIPTHEKINLNHLLAHQGLGPDTNLAEEVCSRRDDLAPVRP